MHTLGADALRERYPRFDDFLRVRDELDPERRFQNPPYLERVLGGVGSSLSLSKGACRRERVEGGLWMGASLRRAQRAP